MLLSTAVLGVAGVIALFLTVTRGWADRSSMHIHGAVQIALFTILFQAAHFTEEFLTGLHEQLPTLFGFAPMSLEFFVAFNLAWLVIWGLSAWGLVKRRRAALFPLWFLGIACVANLAAHPFLSVLARGYFPGLLTSPAVGVLGILLLRRLLLVTQNVGSSPRAAQKRQ